MPRRPATAARPLLAVDRQDRRQDRHPPAQPDRSPLYKQWIDNDRQLRALIDRMRNIAAKATELIIKETSTSKARV